MIEFGLSDLSLKLGNGEILCGIKCVLCYSNETFRKILLDPQVEAPVVVYENVNKDSLMLLFEYYGDGRVDINEDNVCGLLLLSLYYNEKELFNELKYYIINHMNEKIVKDLLSNNLMKIEMLNELYKICDNYIRDNLYLMIENEMMNELCIDRIKHILSLDNILVRNENSLLDNLLKYYKVNKNEIEESKETKNEFDELLEYVNWRKLKYESISIDELEPFNIQEMLMKSSKHENNHRYCSIPKLSNFKFHSIIQKYYLNPELLKTFEESHCYEIHEMDISEDINMILESDDMKLMKVLIVILLRVKYEIPVNQKWISLLEILKNIKDDSENENEEMNIETDSIRMIYETCGYKILLKMLNMELLGNEKCSLIVDYLITNKIINDEERKEEIKEIIKDEEIKRMFFINPLTIFKYDKNVYEYEINEEISIKCECDGEECEFSINPELPNGLTLNKKTGEISGKLNEEMKKTEYEIECKQMKKKKMYKIWLIKRFIFIDNCKSGRMSISENRKKVTCNDEGYNHCYLNMKLEKGIYHFKYKSTYNDCHRPGFGVSTINNYTGYKLYQHESSLCIWMNASSQLYGSNQVNNPGFCNHNGDEYEFIVNMKERTISIKQNDGEEYLIFDNIPSLLYPFVAMDHDRENIELLSVVVDY